MSFDFTPVSCDRRAEYMERLAASGYAASDYSFVNIWGWGEVYGLEWAWDEGLVWLRQTQPELVHWAPVGAVATVDWSVQPRPVGASRCIRVPEPLALRWQELPGVSVAESRDHFDYLYDRQELAELKGNRFHKKKNLLNQFLKGYVFSYQDLSTDCIEPALDMQERWCRWRDCESEESLVLENEAIVRVLQHWDRLPGMIGGAIHVADRIIAYTVAEALTADSLVIHFEKGQNDYKGVYQAINQMFAANAPAQYRYINREQDLGNEGLRQAKLSYNPVGFVKKYEVRW